jgi:Nuclear transport factor 2 (NTF2) domain
MLTFEGEQFQGSENIVNKLRGVGKVVHQVKSLDVQPSASGNAIVIFVTGNVRIGDANANPLHFCEMFQLVSTGPNAYYVHNDIFRLNYGL